MPEVAPVVAPTPTSSVVEQSAAPPEAAEKPQAAPQVDELDEAAKAAAKAKRIGGWKRQQEAEAAKLRAQAQAAAQENQALKAQLAEVKKFQDTLKTGGVKALRQLGLSEREIQESIVEEGSIENVVKNIKAELDATRRELQAERDAKAKEVATQAERNAEQVLIDLAKVKGKDRYPLLSQQLDRHILRDAKELLVDLSKRTNPKTGQPAHIGVTLEDVCEHLEYEARKAAPKAQKTETKTETETKQNLVVGSDKTQSGKAKPIPTLTDKLGTTRSSIPDDSKLTVKQQRAQMADQLRAMKLAKK